MRSPARRARWWRIASASSGAEAGDGSPRSDLARLLQTEERLDARIASAEQDVARLCAQAEHAARDAGTRLAEELQAASSALAVRIEQERDRELAEIEASAERDATFYRDMSEASVDELAKYVVARVIGAPVGGEAS